MVAHLPSRPESESEKEGGKEKEKKRQVDTEETKTRTNPSSPFSLCMVSLVFFSQRFVRLFVRLL